ncbi:MAG: S-layer homology domain-containing protein, partial [Clostridiales bacterium]
KVPNKKYPTLESVEFRGASDSQNLILKLKFSNNVGSIDEKQEDRWDMTGINQQNLTKFHLKVENGETIANMQAQPHPDAAKHTDESKYIYIYADGLDINKNYVLTVDEDFYANMGNSLATPYEVYFNIAGTSLDFKALKKLPEEVEIPALHLLSSSIINGSKNVALDSQITFSFAYNVSDPEVLENNRQCFTMTQGQQKVAIKIEKGSTEKDIVVIPVNKLLKSTEYKIVVDKNMMARNGATMSSPANLYFTTKGDESVPSGGGGGGGGGGGISPVPDPNANKEDVKNKEDQGDIYFSDVKDSWAVKDINKLADLGIVTGNPDKKFLPDKKISRAEAVIMLVRALELDSSQKITYQDTANHWAKDFISIAAANGMVKGINKNQF